MMYAAIVSVLFGLAGVALEHGLRHARRPGRWVWVVVMVGSIVVPIVTRSEPEPLAPSNAAASAGWDNSLLPRISLPRTSDLEALDAPLIVLWFSGSLVVATILLMTQLRMRRETADCLEQTVHGVAVRRTRSFGPAVIGCVKSVVVLPAWVDGLDAEWRRLMVLHEQQHVRAGDSRLLTAAVVVTALQPWNLALWWQLRRLRQAIELDCDQRVLNAGIDIRTYSELLIEISRRRMPAWFPAVALSNVRTFLARRITIMADHLTPTRHVKALVAAAAGTVLIALGCHAPSPLSANNAADTVVADVKLVAEPQQDSTMVVTADSATVIHLIPRIRVREAFETQSLLIGDGTKRVLHVREENGQAYVRLDLVHEDDPTAADVALTEEVPFEVRLEVVEGRPHITLKVVREPS
jgi:beta-lactamase regulating signal transducer with metallopeptidase domain